MTSTQKTNTLTSDDHPRSVAKSALSFLSGTAFSRVSGLCRDMSMAFCFGTDPAIAAFIVAYRFASLLRRIFGEGALLTSFVPHFESHRGDNPKQAAQFFRDIFFSLSIVLIILISCIEVGLFAWLQYGAPSTDNSQIILLTMLMLPSLLFLCLYSLCSGLLQCEKQYFLTGIAPVGLNIVWIAAVWLLKDIPPQLAVIPLSISIVAACFFQWIVTFPNTVSFLKRFLSWREFFQVRLFSPEMYAMLGSISLGVIGVSAAQINSAVDTVFARYASLQGPAFLNYAIHLQQLPLALFGIGVSSAMLPPLSRAIRSGAFDKYRELLHFALSNTLLLLLPCSLAIFAMGGAAINLIYGRGDFDSYSTVQTTYCLWGYGLGLVPMAIGILLTPAFFAKKDFWTPTVASVSSIGLNLILNYLFVVIFGWGAASLAVSTSLSAFFNAAFLFYQLKKKTGIFMLSSLAHSSWKTAVAAVAATAVTLLVGHLYFQDPMISAFIGGAEKPFARDFYTQLAQFSILFSVFCATFGVLLRVLGATEVLALFRRAEIVK